MDKIVFWTKDERGKMHSINSMKDKYNLDITITLDTVPDGYDYNLMLLDKYSRLLSVGKSNGNGSKSITIPNWCIKEDGYTLKVQTTEGAQLISEESYHLLFRENTLHMEFVQLQNKMYFDYVIRKKLWEKKHMTGAISGATSTYMEKLQAEENYKELLDKKKKEQEAIKDIAEDAVIQTGSNAYTQKQWNGMLKNFDEIAENSREEMRIRHEKQYEKQVEEEERARQAVMEDYIEAVQEAKRNRARQLQEQYLKEIYEKKAQNS